MYIDHEFLAISRLSISHVPIWIRDVSFIQGDNMLRGQDPKGYPLSRKRRIVLLVLWFRKTSTA